MFFNCGQVVILQVTPFKLEVAPRLPSPPSRWLTAAENTAPINSNGFTSESAAAGFVLVPASKPSGETVHIDHMAIERINLPGGRRYSFSSLSTPLHLADGDPKYFVKS